MRRLFSSAFFWLALDFFAVALCFLLYLKPFQNDFPLAPFQTNLSFNQTYVKYKFYSEKLHQNEFPFWNPHLNSGYSPLADSELTLLNPFNLLFLKLLPFPFNLKLLYLFSFLGAAGGTFTLLNFLGFKPPISFLGTLFFVFSGSFLSYLASFPYFQSFSLVPWLAWAMLRLFRKADVSSLVLAGFILAWQIFSGPIDVAALTLSALFCLLIFSFLAKKTTSWKKNLSQILIFFLAVALGFSLSAAKLWPLAKFSGFHYHNLKFFYNQSFPFKNLVSFVSPKAGSFSVHFGAVALLTLISLPFLKKLKIYSPGKLFYLLGLFSLVSLFTALPASSPFYVFYLFPPFYLAGSPLIFLVFSSLGLSLLTAKILDKLNQAKKLKIFRLPVFLAILTELFLFLILSLPQRTAQQTIKKIEQNSSFINKIDRNKRVWFTSENFNLQEPTVVPDNAQLWGISSLNQGGFKTKRSEIYFSLLYSTLDYNEKDNFISTSPETEKLLALQGVGYILTGGKMDRFELLDGNEKKYLYQVSFALPEKRVLNKFKIAQTERELKEILLAEEFSPQTEAIIEGQDQPRLLQVIAQSYYPELSAKAGKEKRKVVPVNLNQQGIVLRAAEEKVTLSWPKCFLKGIVFSLTFLVLALIFLLVPLHKFLRLPSIFSFRSK